ncbi:aquaporin Z [Ruminococcus sp. YRD2003]|uniref:MIP/aquaporin family protein n=1 Tax=Ruminococcus sp. YRD2003 TaxID=1452313 RepID=UPI0008D2E8FB|nr:aquaporin Z [Ruminococcus flavefaciens]
MDSFRKYVAEFFGTFVLVFLGCGTAMLVGCDATSGCGYLLTALAFGLVIVGMAYCIGNISGCHINPAVSLGVLITGGISGTDFCGYVISQILGAFAASATLGAIFDLGDIQDMTGGFGANGLGSLTEVPGDITAKSVMAGLLIECILTFIFVLTILGVTSKKFNHGSFGGLIIGLTLTLVHIFGIGLTGTSVNPARSIAPAVFAGGDSLKYVWVFIVGPLAGAAIAAFLYKWFEAGVKAPKAEVEAEKPVKSVASKPNNSKKKKK